MLYGSSTHIHIKMHYTYRAFSKFAELRILMLGSSWFFGCLCQSLTEQPLTLACVYMVFFSYSLLNASLMLWHKTSISSRTIAFMIIFDVSSGVVHSSFWMLFAALTLHVIVIKYFVVPLCLCSCLLPFMQWCRRLTQWQSHLFLFVC